MTRRICDPDDENAVDGCVRFALYHESDLSAELGPVSLVFDIAIDKDVVRRVHYPPERGFDGPSWLTFPVGLWEWGLGRAHHLEVPDQGSGPEV